MYLLHRADSARLSPPRFEFVVAQRNYSFIELHVFGTTACVLLSMGETAFNSSTPFNRLFRPREFDYLSLRSLDNCETTNVRKSSKNGRPYEMIRHQAFIDA